MRATSLLVGGVTLAVAVVAAPQPSASSTVLYPHDVQGPGYQSARLGQTVNDVQGVLTAKDANGCFIQTPNAKFDGDDRTSEAVYVFRSAACSDHAIGDLVQIGTAKVTEYSYGGANLHLTELTSTTNVTLVQAASKTISPVVVGGILGRDTSRLVAKILGRVADLLGLGTRQGKNRMPPTRYIGVKNPFGSPFNQSTLEGGSRAKSLDVTTYGADFWESLESMLITLPAPTVLGPVTSFGEVYIVPSGVPAPSRNSRGGLTLAADENASSDDLRWDSNPQAINMIKAFDNSTIEDTVRLGDVLDDVTGIVGYDFGLYTFTPLTAPKVQTHKQGKAIPAPFTSTGKCDNLIAATYNVENLSPSDTNRITKIGSQIDLYLKDPDVVVVNEIQDDDGPTNDGVVVANKTLEAVVGAIKGAAYAYADVDPVNDKDGGEPGGNIRQALLWRTDRLALTPGIPVGTSTQSVDVVAKDGKAQLTLNPGRIDPADSAWTNSRKPIVGQFDLRDGSGASIFVIGLHLTSKGGSGTPYQNPQPPKNGGVESRDAQAEEVRSFVQRILNVQSDAKVIVAGDLNEFSFVDPLNALVGGSPAVLKEVTVQSRVERYSYIFQQNCQELDHLLVSPSIAQFGASLFVPHVNTWTYAADQVSDHDPIVAKLNVC